MAARRRDRPGSARVLGCRVRRGRGGGRGSPLNEIRGRADEEVELKVRERTAELEKANRRLEAEIAQYRRAEDVFRQSGTEFEKSIKETEERFEHLAHHDPLTHLPNRLLLRDRVDRAVAQARRLDRRLALVILDVDGFNRVNDSLGHAAGDEALRCVAVRLISCTRTGDTVARLGGDEFVMLLECVLEPDEAGVAARRALEAVARPFRLSGREMFLTGCAGISVFPDHGNDFETLLKNAGVALHRAQGLGRSTHQLYTADLTRKALEQMVVESELRRAFKREEFVLHFQPQVSLATGKVVGVEALARWNHPERGLLAPKEFISVAEETGLVEALGSWTLAETCRQAVAWQGAGLPPFRVAVNISAQEISRTVVVQRVTEALRESGLSAGRLELEITEGFLMVRPSEALTTLMSLKALGVSLAIDDFGTGFSSLSHLKQFPIDRLKIDRSFVQAIPLNPDDDAIVRAVVTLAHGLGLKVLAEGVETEEQAAFLRENGCDEIQGFLFSGALAADDLARFVRDKA